jgi:cytochrome c556
MKRWILVLSLLPLFVLGGRADAQDPPREDASYWMKRKLELSQDVLEGLALADYEKIGDSARTMQRLNAIENFVRGRNEAYRAQLEIFRYANESLIKNADKQNLDGAALAFNQMTLSCVNCHKQLREQK